jgi:hypothetical protein
VARLKEIKSDPDAADERKVLQDYRGPLIEQDAEPAPSSRPRRMR